MKMKGQTIVDTVMKHIPITRSSGAVVTGDVQKKMEFFTALLLLFWVYLDFFSENIQHNCQ